MNCTLRALGRIVSIAGGMAAALLLTGCASIVNGHDQSVSVTSKSKDAEVVGARCSLNNDKGVWYVTTPGSVSVQRSYNDLTVNCAMPGQPNGTAAVKSTTTGAVFGNILVGGVLGAGIDVATGAAYNYPNVISVELGRDARFDTLPSNPKQGSTSTATKAALAAQRVPYLDDARQAEYRAFLDRPMPRAFAIASNNHAGWSWSDNGKATDRRERALAGCARAGGIDCQLYLVDEEIVFKAPAASSNAAAPTAVTSAAANTAPAADVPPSKAP